MRKKVKVVLKILGGLVALLLVLLVTAFIMLNTSTVQQKLLSYSVHLLQEKLQTKVKIDSIHVDFLTFDVNLMGVDVEDRQQRKMLQADQLTLSLELKDLLTHKVEVSKAELEGVRALLYHPKDSVANYQFVIDAFKSDKKSDQEIPKKKKEGKDNKLTFDLNQLHLSKVNIEHHGVTKKGHQLTCHLSLSELMLKEKWKKQILTIDSLRFITENHRPRKNVVRPHRGAFDTGHFDITAHLELTVNHLGKDTAHVSLTKFVATDPASGFNVKDLRFDAGINKETASLSNVVIQQESTVLRFDSATIQFPNKKIGRRLSYQTSMITGRTLLKDISKTFAPALSRFSIPLELTVFLSGTDSTMKFRNIHVNTTDKKLRIDAEGGFVHMGKKRDLDLRFRIKKMTTSAQTTKKVIDQFLVKKFMMKQLNNLETINYTGDLKIIYKKEFFKGLLRTSAGEIDFHLAINGITKYIQGDIFTESFHLGKVLEMPDIGNVTCRAGFTFDISKQRTAIVRKQRGGNLPIGEVNVSDARVRYKKINLKNIDATIKSDGAIAEGHIQQKHNMLDLLCDFTFTNTDSIKKMKIIPKFQLHSN